MTRDVAQADTQRGRHVVRFGLAAERELVDQFLPRLAAALAGDGHALLPVTASDPARPEGAEPAQPPGPEVTAATHESGFTRVSRGSPDTPVTTPAGLTLGPDDDDPADPTALVVATSGSTGRPRFALLPASALLASASATHDRLGGPGHWLLALPAHHVAGLQVLVRSLVSRTSPSVLDPAGFTADRFAAAARAHLASGKRSYVSLVPTQLQRIVAAGGEPLALLGEFGAVLVGGASTPPQLVSRARAAGVRVVLSYGMTETCGGCVYDGRPLDGVAVELEDDGRIRIAGPVLARGFLGRPAGAEAAFVTGADARRWLRTNDLGRLDDGRLSVVGRVDDVIVTGGVNVAPAVVEAAISRLSSVAEAVVCGVADEEWGRRVVAAVVPSDPQAPPTLAEVREAVAGTLGRASAPRQLVVLPRLPVRGPGKPDRAAVAALAQTAEAQAAEAQAAEAQAAEAPTAEAQAAEAQTAEAQAAAAPEAGGPGDRHARPRRNEG